ncbi:MAG: hypothetical protein V4642_04145 [Bacteroidota bacterium]
MRSKRCFLKPYFTFRTAKLQKYYELAKVLLKSDFFKRICFLKQARVLQIL